MSLTLEEKIARRGENVSDQAVCELALYAGHILLESGAELFRVEDTIRRMAELGVEMIVEIGPGKVLSGFVKKTVPAIKTCAVETCADIDALCEALKGA